MYLNDFVSGIHRMSKPQLQMLSAKLFTLAALLSALGAVCFFMARQWPLGLAFAGVAVMNASLAFVQYALSRRV